MMAEPGLILAFADIRSQVGFFLGYGIDSDIWSVGKVATVNRVIARGARRFYYPPPTQAGGVSHCWSWLEPEYRLTTVESQEDYDLPPGTTTVQDPIVFDAAVQYDRIRVVGEQFIHRKRAYGITTGVPVLAAIAPTKPGAAVSSRYRLLLWPSPNGVWDLILKLGLTPDPLSEDQPYPMGGAIASDAFLECCLWAAEEELNDTMGLHKAAAMERLTTAIYQDAKQKHGNTLGYNSDPGMNRGRVTRDTWRQFRGSTLTVNGTVIE